MKRREDGKLFFSIVVVCLNPGKKLNETLDSITVQSYENYEIIIKDGNSTDGSIEGIALTDKMHVYRNRDTGIYDAMNQAVAYVKGDYILFLNCGDKFYGDHVLAEVAAFANRFSVDHKDKLPDILYGNLYNEKQQSLISSAPEINNFTCYRNVPCHQTCFYSKELFSERGYCLDYKVRGDYEHFLWCYFFKKAVITHMPIVVSTYEGGGFSETAANRKRSVAEHKKIVAMYMSKNEITKYQAIMLLTLAPVRGIVAESKLCSGAYNALKKLIYNKK